MGVIQTHTIKLAEVAERSGAFAVRILGSVNNKRIVHSAGDCEITRELAQNGEIVRRVKHNERQTIGPALTNTLHGFRQHFLMRLTVFTRMLGGDAVDLAGSLWDFHTRIRKQLKGFHIFVVDTDHGGRNDPRLQRVRRGCFEVEGEHCVYVKVRHGT